MKENFIEQNFELSDSTPLVVVFDLKITLIMPSDENKVIILIDSANGEGHENKLTKTFNVMSIDVFSFNGKEYQLGLTETKKTISGLYCNFLVREFS